MEQPDNASGKSKWYGRLTWVFLILFSIFWSLGSFFFWLLLGLTIIFGLYTFHYSDVKISFFDRSANQRNPYQSQGQPSQNSAVLFRKIFRTIIIIAGSFILFLFVVGVFSGNDDDSNNEPTETPEDQTSQSSTINSTSGDDVSNYMSRGIDFFNNGEYDSAIFYYDKVLQRNPDNADGIYNKALVYYMKEDYRKSIGIVKKCLRDNPDYNSGWWLLGDDYFSLTQYDSAIVSLEKAYGNNFKEPGFLELLGDTYFKKDNRSRAKEIYLEVIQQDTTRADVYRQLAILDPEKGEDYRARAIALEQTK